MTVEEGSSTAGEIETLLEKENFLALPPTDYLTLSERLVELAESEQREVVEARLHDLREELVGRFENALRTIRTARGDFETQFNQFQIVDATRNLIPLLSDEDVLLFSPLLAVEDQFIRNQTVELLATCLNRETEGGSQPVHELLYTEIRSAVTTGENMETAQTMLRELRIRDDESLPVILFSMAENPPDEESQRRALRVLVSLYDLTPVRQEVVARLDAGREATVSQNLNRALEFLTPADGLILKHLREVYERVNFGSYEINARINEFELNLLRRFLSRQGRALDLGMGYGRHLIPLTREDFNVFGVDYLEKHVRAVLAKEPKARVRQANWHALPFTEQFDRAYCLGRSFLHNISLEQQRSFLLGVNEALIKGGELLIDIPDVNLGSYRQETEAFIQEMEKERGLEHFSQHLIYDSPDGQHYFIRLAPNLEQMQVLTWECGFKLEVVSRKELPNEKGDVNIYLKLIKIHSREEAEEMVRARLESP